jgi:geranylgeranylglycerol-phosphate geranylgeranyltransferase
MALITFVICAAGNALNDRLDIKADSINHPERPLPSGALKETEASIVALALFVFGNLLSLLLSPKLILLTVTVSLLLLWYNWSLKRIAVVGNLVVALLGATTVVAGGLAAGGNILELPGSLFPALLAFLLHFAREMTKDVQDMEGDRRVGFSTYPLKKDARQALLLASVTVALMILLSLAPLYFDWYSKIYAVLVLLTVDLPLIVVLVALNVESKPKTLKTASLVFKFGMVMGLLAIYFGGVGGV